MAYRHELLTTRGGETGMAHYRIGQSAGGLAVATEIARTTPKYSSETVATVVSKSDLVVAMRNPLVEFGMGVGGSPLAERIIESADCADLKDFGDQGVQRWTRVLRGVGSATGITLVLAENTHIVEETTAGGLVVGDSAQTEFESYVATADEIETLEAMQAKLAQMFRQPDANPVPGPYL